MAIPNTSDPLDLYQGHWTQQILDEMCNSLLRDGRVTLQQVTWVLQQMSNGFPHFMIEGHEIIIPLMTNDEKDRHVLAAAVYVGADTIVTSNHKDFSASSREPFGIGLDSPDEFLTDLWIGNTSRLARALVKMAARLKTPPYTVRELVDGPLQKHAPTFAELALASEDLEHAVQAEQDNVPLPQYCLF